VPTDFGCGRVEPIKLEIATVYARLLAVLKKASPPFATGAALGRSSIGISRAYSISTRPQPTERRRKTALIERLGLGDLHRQPEDGALTCLRVTLLPARQPLNFEIGSCSGRQIYGIGCTGWQTV